MSLYPLIRPLAFALDAETAHRVTIAALKLRCRRAARRTFLASLGRTVAGLDFPTPVGLAAGFDKDAEVAEQMLEPRLRLRRGRHADAAPAARAIRARACSG